MISTRSRVPLRVGKNQQQCEIISFNNLPEDKEHVALVFKADRLTEQIPLVRLHSECLTGDAFYSSRCDCGQQLNEAIDVMSERGGIIIYLRQEGRGIGLYNKLDAYEHQVAGMDTFAANRIIGFDHDLRVYDSAAEILKHLGFERVKLLTNNGNKKQALIKLGIDVVEEVNTKTYITEDNKNYLQAKREIDGHALAV
ncbi:GTP cyclohydrolase II RibA [Vibrio diabolicus]|uniref:GTP cyclohydrolase II RibA n=1 Tax=Vibrio diabolicus TaxID=50719 RepID=UPI0015932BCC|nr:GTP cyclohydrolase II RibA [Vibrio diabolicus]MCS0316079.1 GTP cyclohydrolase II RibA [Vibrio diabolicus]NVC50468.1 GTP cyclohydrolase II RibA [Vibrio diabolicus]